MAGFTQSYMVAPQYEESHFTSMTPKTPLLDNIIESNNQYFTPKATRIAKSPAFLKLSTPKNSLTRSLPTTCNTESSVLKSSCSSLETWLKSIKTNNRLDPKSCESIKVSRSSLNLAQNCTNIFREVKEGVNKTNVKYLDNKVNRRDVLSLNIAELFLSGKRKRQPDGNVQCLKQCKRDKENIMSESSCSISRGDDTELVPRIKDLLDHAEDSSQS